MNSLTHLGLISIATLSTCCFADTARVAFFSLHSVQANQPQPCTSQFVTSVSPSATFKPGMNRVTFQSEGEQLVGNLYLPANYQAGDKLPTVIVTGAWMTIKEQMPAIYAQKLSDQGFAALAFDFRTFGESGGNLRNFESPTAKIADIKNAISYLQTVDAVDADRIVGLGICASAGYMTSIAEEDSRLKALVTIAPWLHNPEIVNTVYGGEAAVQKLIAQGRAARVLRMRLSLTTLR
jgi:uncharacterized protein